MFNFEKKKDVCFNQKIYIMVDEGKKMPHLAVFDRLVDRFKSFLNTLYFEYISFGRKIE